MWAGSALLAWHWTIAVTLRLSYSNWYAVPFHLMCVSIPNSPSKEGHAQKSISVASLASFGVSSITSFTVCPCTWGQVLNCYSVQFRNVWKIAQFELYGLM